MYFLPNTSMTNLVTITPPAENPRFNYTQNAFEGGKYKETQNLDITDIAKLLRTELKEKLPGFKFSLRCEKYAGGCSLNVLITGIPESFDPFNPMWRIGNDRDEMNGLRREFYKELNADGEAIIKTVEDICNQYNYDDCDSMTDYFNVSFYLHVNMGIQHPRYNEVFPR